MSERVGARRKMLAVMWLAAWVAFLHPAAGAARASAHQVRIDLANAFSGRDVATIESLVSDTYGGLRFFRGSTDAEFWRATGAALRDATPLSSSARKATYRVVVRRRDEPPRARDVDLFLDGDDKWRLDLNSLLGPFPHGLPN